MKTLLSLCTLLFVFLFTARAADISVDNATIDNTSSNNGTSSHWLNFGYGSGEGIGSQRTSGPGQYGLDFYTYYGTRRMHIGLNGGVNIGGGTYDPGAGNLEVTGTGTFIGTVTTNPDAAAQGLRVNGDFTGATPPDRCSKNEIQITADDGPYSGAFTSALNVYHKFGGTNKTSGVNSYQGMIELTSPTNASNPNRNYVAGYFAALGTSGDGGTGLTGPYFTDSEGSLFGLNPYVRVGAGATYLRQAVGIEVDIDVQTGGSVASRQGIIVNDQGNSTTQGAMNDSAISIARNDSVNPNSGTTGWRCALTLGYDNGSGRGHPLATNGSVIHGATGAATIGRLIDMPTYTMGTSLMRLNAANYTGTTGTHTVIIKWLKVEDDGGNTYYIPAYAP
jgi:hypothetical protein